MIVTLSTFSCYASKFSLEEASVFNAVCGSFEFVELISLWSMLVYRVINMSTCLISSETQMYASFGVLQHWREFTDSSWVIAHMNGKRRNGMVSQRDYQRWDFPFHMWNFPLKSVYRPECTASPQYCFLDDIDHVQNVLGLLSSYFVFLPAHAKLWGFLYNLGVE